MFCENTSQDEGVSLSATPGSSSNETGQMPANNAAANPAESKAAEAGVAKEEESVKVADGAKASTQQPESVDGKDQQGVSR